MNDPLYTVDESRQSLCPDLYNRLLKRFPGGVVMANHGESFIQQTSYDANQGRYYTHVLHSGEYYRVNCPFCGDTKKRLWVNHAYNQLDANGREMRFLATCYNENCLSDFEKWKRFNDVIYGFQNAQNRNQSPFAVYEGIIEDPSKPAQMPGPVCQEVALLPAAHKAVQYMCGERRYSRDMLTRYQISYCAQAHPQYRAAQDRIVFPIVMDEKLVGWQCRYIGDADWHVTPKYYGLPGMRKRNMLYNFDRAKHMPFVVVVEGPTDVHVIGDAAVAVLGKHLSRYQVQRLVSTWEGKPIVMLFDSDARDEMRGAVQDLVNYRQNPVVEVELHEGFDPGDYDQITLWNTIHARARDRGINLPAVGL